MSRPQKIHPPIKGDLNSILAAVADGGGMERKPRPIIILHIDSEIAEELRMSVPNGVSVSVQEKFARSASPKVYADAVITFTRDISVSLLAGWLYGKIKNENTCQIKQGGNDIQNSQHAISRAVKSEIEIGRND